MTSCGTNSLGSSQNTLAKAGMPSYVLVHGAWHGGWCWQDVAVMLRKSGANVFTPTLTGLGKRQHLLNVGETGLQTHIQDVVNLIEFEELDNVILVGHSYAGIVITGVADKIGDKISELIYLDAKVPVNGGSLVDLDNVMSKQQVDSFVASRDTDQTGMLPNAPLAFLGIDPEHPKAEWVMRRMTPHPIKTLVDRLSFDGPTIDALKKTYVLCTEHDRSEQDLERITRITSGPNWELLELASGHDAMVTEPEKLVGLFVQIVDAQ